MKRAIITTPMPTLDEVAKNLGISKTRQKELMRIVLKHSGGGLSQRHRDSDRSLKESRGSSSSVTEKVKAHPSKR